MEMGTGVKAMNLFTELRGPAERTKDALPFWPLFDNATESFLIGYVRLAGVGSEFSSYVPIGI
jgi:hypothetical protein